MEISSPKPIKSLLFVPCERFPLFGSPQQLLRAPGLCRGSASPPCLHFRESWGARFPPSLEPMTPSPWVWLLEVPLVFQMQSGEVLPKTLSPWGLAAVGQSRQGRARGMHWAVQREEWLHNCLFMLGALGPVVIYASAAPNADNEHVLHSLCEWRAVKEQQAAIKL